MRACTWHLLLCSVAQAGSVGSNHTEPAWATEHKKRASIRPQALMSAVGSNHTQLMRSCCLITCGLILALVVLCCSSRFGWDEPRRSHAWIRCGSDLLNLHKQRALQEQVSGHKLAWVRCGSTLSNSCELVVQYCRTTPNSALFRKQVVLYCSSRFGRVEPHRTHASLWPETCSCSALVIKQVR